MLKIEHVCSGEKLSVKLHEQFLFLSEKKMKLRRASVRSGFPLHWPVWRTPCLRPCLLLLIDFFSCACLSHQGSGVLNGPGKSGSPSHALTASQTKLYFNSRKDEMLPLMRVAVYPASRRHLWKKNSALRGFRSTDKLWKTQRWVCVWLTPQNAS